MPRLKAYIQQINTLRARYYAALPGKEALVSMVNGVEVFEQVYNSNAIENSTLTLEETERILLQVDLERYISEREIFEAKNLARVMEYIEAKAATQDLNKELILLLHKMLIGNIREDIAGRFRMDEEWVKVGNHIAPAPKMVESMVDEMLNRDKADISLHIVERLARLHLTFEQIHPFVDGNGRIGRVILNFLLLREGYVPLTIRHSNRVKYYQAFQEFNRDGRVSLMADLIGRALVESYHKRLAYLEGKKIMSLKEFSLIQKKPLNNLLNKAERQTIEAFREKGVWKIGV